MEAKQTLPTAAEVIEARCNWLYYLTHIRRLSNGTIRAYEADTRQFLCFLAQYKGQEIDLAVIDKLELSDIRAFLAKKQKDKCSSKAIARLLASIRSFFAYLSRENLAHAPCGKTIRPPKQGRSLPKALTKENALALVGKKK